MKQRFTYSSGAYQAMLGLETYSSSADWSPVWCTC